MGTQSKVSSNASYGEFEEAAKRSCMIKLEKRNWRLRGKRKGEKINLYFL